MEVKLQEELARTKPDFKLFSPESSDGSYGDTGNEHCLVFDGPDGSLMAVWTQSSREGASDQRIVFSKSNDDGVTWEKPEKIADKGSSPTTQMASWGFPMVSSSGRIYVLYNKHIGVNDIFTHTTGLMAGIYSDDCGKTWSKEQEIKFIKDKWDNPDSSVPSNWIIWQKPERLSHGKYFAGFTKWISPAVRPPAPIKIWWAEGAVVEFMRFENIDDNPEPKDIRISFFMTGDNALRVPLIDHPEHSAIQEPSIVKLPDNRLFCIMRTTLGSPYYVISSDEGESWSEPQVLKYSDDGEKILHPCSPCPIYQIAEDKYIFFFHNHDGNFKEWEPKDSNWHRRPIVVSAGTFAPNDNQPLKFSSPKFMMDNDGVALGLNGGRADLAMYASMTIKNGEPTLWYPDRKFFLLGKKIPLIG